MDNEKWFTIGLQKRFLIWRNILSMTGNDIGNGEVEVTFNISRPIDGDELFSNLKMMQDMKAISTESIMEQSGMIKDTKEEIKKIKNEDTSKDTSSTNMI